MNETNIDLPSNWVWASLDELMDRLQYGFTAKAKQNSAGPKFLRITDINEGVIDWDTVPNCEIRSSEIEKYRLFEGDIVFARSGSIEKACMIVDPPEAIFASYLIRGRPLHPTIGIWTKYFVQSAAYLSQIVAAASGIGMQNVNAKKIGLVSIPIAPLPEQSRITSKIESLQSRSTKARKALDAIPPLLEKFRQSVLSSVFRGDLTADWRAQNPDIEPAEKLLERIRKERRKRWEEDELAKMKAKGKTPKDDKWKKKYKEPEPVDNIDLPELPEGWCWGPLEILGIHQSGIAYKSKDFTNSGIQVIKLGNLYQGRFDLSRDPTFLPQDHPAVFEGLLHQGDLIISQTGTRFKRDYGNFVIIPDDADKLVLNQRLLRVRLVESSLAKWVLYTTRLTFYRDYFFSRETGGVNQGNVGVEGVMRGPIPFAPYQEMKVILRQIEDITKYTENIEAISRKEIRNLSQLDQSTLSKAFRGELVSQDPNDEPASVLLERIKQEKASLESGKKKRARRSRTAKR